MKWLLLASQQSYVQNRASSLALIIHCSGRGARASSLDDCERLGIQNLGHSLLDATVCPILGAHTFQEPSLLQCLPLK